MATFGGGPSMRRSISSSSYVADALVIPKLSISRS